MHWLHHTLERLYWTRETQEVLADLASGAV
jgi:hypothetical protein